MTITTPSATAAPTHSTDTAFYRLCAQACAETERENSLYYGRLNTLLRRGVPLTAAVQDATRYAAAQHPRKRKVAA